MRIYEGASRQNYEQVLRSLGAVLDQRGMREITVNETDDGFIVQGLALSARRGTCLGRPEARVDKETFHLREEDMTRFMDEAQARRQGRSTDPLGGPGNRRGLLRTRCACWARTSTSSSRVTPSSSSRTTNS